MIDVYSDVVSFKGSHYDFGYMQGELLRDSFILPNRKKQWFTKREYNFIINKAEFKTVIDAFAPAIWDEIQGLADALKMNLVEAIKQFGGYYLEYVRSGCSIFTSEDYFIRNYDHHPYSYEGRFVLYAPTDNGFATIGPSMQITGRTDGMNQKGLVMGYNFINRRQSTDGFICNMIGRIILELCADVDEAIYLLKEIPHRHSFSYVLLDEKGVTKVIEASPRNVKVREANVCTNHFEKLTAENRYRMDDSMKRKNTMLKNKDVLTDGYDAFKMMNDPKQGVFSTTYDAWSGTLHSTIYRPKEKIIGFSIGANRPPFLFYFKKWLDSEHFTVKKIKGKLDTNDSFINMRNV